MRGSRTSSRVVSLAAMLRSGTAASDTDDLGGRAWLGDDAIMNTTGTVSERLRQLEAATRSDKSAVAQPAIRILGHVAEHHLISVVAALEAHCAGHGELRAIENTLVGLESEAGDAG